MPQLSRMAHLDKLYCAHATHSTTTDHWSAMATRPKACPLCSGCEICDEITRPARQIRPRCGPVINASRQCQLDQFIRPTSIRALSKATESTGTNCKLRHQIIHTRITRKCGVCVLVFGRVIIIAYRSNWIGGSGHKDGPE